MARKLVIGILLAILTAGLVVVGMVLTRPEVSPDPSYVDGEQIQVLHTEASDSSLADTLSAMMASPVLVVPSLAEAPPSMLANLYIFTNGRAGRGTRGFQPDVLDSPPQSPGYSPLRAVSYVTWTEPGEAEELRSAAEVLEAERRGQVHIQRTPIVINTPLLSWPTGKR